MKKINVFVYGTLMNNKRKKASLKDNIVTYNRGYPTIIPFKNGLVVGELIEGVNKKTLEAYDYYESVSSGFYERKKMLIETEDGQEIEAFVYQQTKEHTKNILNYIKMLEV